MPSIRLGNGAAETTFQPLPHRRRRCRCSSRMGSSCRSSTGFRASKSPGPSPSDSLSLRGVDEAAAHVVFTRHLLLFHARLGWNGRRRAAAAGGRRSLKSKASHAAKHPCRTRVLYNVESTDTDGRTTYVIRILYYCTVCERVHSDGLLKSRPASPFFQGRDCGFNRWQKDPSSELDVVKIMQMFSSDLFSE